MSYKYVNIIPLIEKSVIESRKGGYITDISVDEIDTTLYTIKAQNANDCTVGSQIDLYSWDNMIFTVTVLSKTANTITFKSEETIENAILWRLQFPFFHFGEPEELREILQSKSKTLESAQTKFPAICLFLDIKQKTSSVIDEAGIYTLNLIVCNSTNQKYSSEKRDTSTFPLLRELLENFINALSKNDAFKIFNANKDISFNSIEHFYWGKITSYDNGQAPLGEWIDAIEINDLSIIVRNSKHC